MCHHIKKPIRFWEFSLFFLGGGGLRIFRKFICSTEEKLVPYNVNDTKSL